MNKSLNFIVSLSGKDAFGRHASVAVVQRHAKEIEDAYMGR